MGLALLSQKRQCLGDKILMKLKYTAVSRIRINHQRAVGQAFGEVIRIDGRNHAVTLAIGDEYGLFDHLKVGRCLAAPRFEGA